MATIGQIGFGVKLGYRLLSASDTGSFTDLGTLVKLGPPKITAGKAEAGTLQSTFKPYVPTTPEGDGSLQVLFIPGDAGTIAFRTSISRAPIPGYTFQITYLNGGFDQFDAYPLTFEPDDIERETVMMATINYTLIDAPVYNSGSTPPVIPGS